MKRTSTLRIATTLASGLALAAAVPAALAERWDMPTAYGATNYITQSYMQFAEDVKERTGGALEIVVHPGGSLYGGSDILRAVREGQVPIGARFLAAHAADDPVFGLDTVPFLATTVEEARALYAASRPALEEALESRGLKLLYAPVWPPQGLFIKNAVNSIGDLRGVRFRAYDNNTTRLAELVGAIPTKTEAAEIAQAFSTGMAEAMTASGAIGVGQKMWDFVDNYYLINAWMPKSAVIVNLAAWNGLDEATRTALTEAAAVAEAAVWEEVLVQNEGYNAALAANGMNVAEPSPELVAGFREVGETMTREWLETTGERGQAIIDAYRAAR